LPKSTAVIGEIGLTGEVRAVSQMEKRVRECARLGFTHIILPRSAEQVKVPGVRVTLVRNVAEAVAILGMEEG